ncbi:MAG: LapA family protein, partial [Bacteroidota bacterium]
MNDFFDLIATFFAELTNEDKILLGILAILVFMIGFIVGWIMQGTKTRRYKKELLLLRKDRDEYEVRYRATETKQKA